MQERINLEALKPQPHPFRDIFRRNKVTGPMLANYLGKHITYVNSMLCGHQPMSKPVHKKLEILVNQLIEDGKESATDEPVES